MLVISFYLISQKIINPAFFYLQIDKNFNEILEHLLRMLNKDVIDHCKNCNQYFNVLRCYVELVSYYMLPPAIIRKRHYFFLSVLLSVVSVPYQTEDMV